MNDIRKRTTPLSVDPLKTSAATGATLAVMGVDSAIPLLHGSQGCAAFAKVFFVQHFREQLPIQTTAIDAIAAVMGSDDNADGALELLAERNRPEVIALISSGLTEMQGSDLGRLKREFSDRHPELAATAVVTIHAPDFCGSFESGYAAAVDALLRQLVRPLPRPQRRQNQINLLLTSALTACDVERVKGYVSAFGLNAIILPDISLTLDGHLDDAHFNPTATGGCHRLEIAEMGASQATIVIGQSLTCCGQWLGDHYAMPVYQFDHLGGLTATDRFIQLLATLSGRPVPASIALTRGGTPWDPQFVTAINQQTCIGCGRCYKVCSRNVFDLVERENDDEDDDDVAMVMSLANAADCIGCSACSRVCPKACHSHTAASVLMA